MTGQNPAWLGEKNVINEVEFCREFVEQMPLICVKGKFYGLDGQIGDDIISRDISIKLTEFVTSNISRKVKNLLEALKLHCHSDPPEVNPYQIHLLNGVVNIDGQFSPEKQFCINRLQVTFDPTLTDPPKPERFLRFISELFYTEDIPTFQEFLGYCLIPSTKGQAMMFLIGNGEEGKSRIVKVNDSIFILKIT